VAGSQLALKVGRGAGAYRGICLAKCERISVVIEKYIDGVRVWNNFCCDAAFVSLCGCRIIKGFADAMLRVRLCTAPRLHFVANASKCEKNYRLRFVAAAAGGQRRANRPADKGVGGYKRGLEGVQVIPHSRTCTRWMAVSATTMRPNLPVAVDGNAAIRRALLSNREPFIY